MPILASLATQSVAKGVPMLEREEREVSGLLIVPALCVVMPFVTLCVTQRFCGVRWIGV
ncbi:hypothetical protein N018_10575 [Pseudomonas syringae CC1557]|uniref:Uncharacterized protein n=1 Tax=Pseudomonas syringae CC1557 TaxID=1357279 RepID=W0N252_PSESX|nr:hypothetical protein N018_10575 [Pseudomonas syringae CC1557]